MHEKAIPHSDWYEIPVAKKLQEIHFLVSNLRIDSYSYG